MMTQKKTMYTEAERIDPICEYRYHRACKTDNELLLHCHDYYELLFFPKCGAQHLANGVVQKLPKGALVFIRPDDYHDIYNPESDSVSFTHLAFTKNLFRCMTEYLTELFVSRPLLEDPYPPYVILDSSESNDLQSKLNSLNSIDYGNSTARAVHMRSLLAQIFTSYFSEKTVYGDNHIPEWLSITCNDMKRIENFSLGIDHMVKLSGRSKEHLCRSLKKHYNITPANFINDIRLTYIANMLVYSKAPIIDLCYESGYFNLSWMYTLFKKKYGVSPAVFQKSNTRAPIN